MYYLSEIHIQQSIQHFYFLNSASHWQSQMKLSDSQAKTLDHYTKLPLSIKKVKNLQFTKSMAYLGRKNSTESGMCVCVCAMSLQSCPALCDLMDCSPPGSSVPGILQARILAWVAMPSSRGSS